MNLYTDKPNLLSLLALTDSDFRSDCIKAMKTQLDVYFNFNKLEVLESEELGSLFKVLTSGVGTTSKRFMEDKIPPRPISDDCHVGMSFKKLVSMYLAEDENGKRIKNFGTLNLGLVGEEAELFNRMFLLRKNFFFEKKIRIGVDFTKWEELIGYAFPLTDMVIIDSYILSDSSLIESNLLRIIETLGSKPKKCFNIIIYTNHNNVNSGINLEKLILEIKSRIKKVSTIEPKVTVIKVRDQRGMESLAEHDRTILTNSYRIYSGDTFNYFDSTNKVITKGREISFSSFGDQENFRLANLLITDLQNALERLNPASIIGDKASGIFKFQL